MFCRNCGKQLAEGAQFCDGCGAQQSVAVAPVAAPRSRSGVVIVAVMAVAVLLVAVLVWAVFLRPTSASDYERRVSDEIDAVLDVPTDIAAVLDDVGQGEGDKMGEQDIAALTAVLDESIETIANARGTIDSLRPPGEYKKAHADVLAALDELSAVADEYAKILEKIDPEDTQGDVEDAFSDRFYVGADDAFRAYRDLSGALDDMGLDSFDAEGLIDEDLY